MKINCNTAAIAGGAAVFGVLLLTFIGSLLGTAVLIGVANIALTVSLFVSTTAAALWGIRKFAAQEPFPVKFADDSYLSLAVFGACIITFLLMFAISWGEIEQPYWLDALMINGTFVAAIAGTIASTFGNHWMAMAVVDQLGLRDQFTCEKNECGIPEYTRPKLYAFLMVAPFIVAAIIQLGWLVKTEEGTASLATAIGAVTIGMLMTGAAISGTIYSLHRLCSSKAAKQQAQEAD